MNNDSAETIANAALEREVEVRYTAYQLAFGRWVMAKIRRLDTQDKRISMYLAFKRYRRAKKALAIVAPYL